MNPTGIVSAERFGVVAIKEWRKIGQKVRVTSEMTGPFYFEAYLRTTGSLARAILYDLTLSIPVNDSEISTVSSTLTRVRSGGFILAPGREYQAMIGPGDGTTRWKACRLIILGD